MGNPRYTLIRAIVLAVALISLSGCATAYIRDRHDYMPRLQDFEEIRVADGNLIMIKGRLILNKIRDSGSSDRRIDRGYRYALNDSFRFDARTAPELPDLSMQSGRIPIENSEDSEQIQGLITLRARGAIHRWDEWILAPRFVNRSVTEDLKPPRAWENAIVVYRRGSEDDGSDSFMTSFTFHGRACTISRYIRYDSITLSNYAYRGWLGTILLGPAIVVDIVTFAVVLPFAIIGLYGFITVPHG